MLNDTSWGSSSGSANGAGANLCAAAVGTETDGSITGPSAVENIVGLKPTLGLVSQDGIIPITHEQDTAGPMARSVTDVAILLGVLQSPFGEELAARYQLITRSSCDVVHFKGRVSDATCVSSITATTGAAFQATRRGGIC